MLIYKLKTRFLCAMGVLFCCMLALSILAFWGNEKLREASQILESTVTPTLKRHLASNSLHDAIRGDVMTSIVNMYSGYQEGISDNKKIFEEHYSALQQNVKANLKAELPKNIQDQIAQSELLLTLYGNTARDVIDAALSQKEAERLLPEFEGAFAKVDEHNNAISASLLAWAAHVRQENIAQADLLKKWLALIAVTGILLVILIPVYAVLFLFKPQAQLREQLQALTENALSDSFKYQNRKDEIGELARALEKLRGRSPSVMQIFAAPTGESDLKALVKALTSATRQVLNNSSDLAKLSTENHQRIFDITERTRHSGEAAKTVKTTLSKLTRALSDVHGHALEAKTSADAVHIELTSRDVTRLSMKELSGEITSVKATIDELAERVRLLSLNASIESSKKHSSPTTHIIASDANSVAQSVAELLSKVERTIEKLGKLNSEHKTTWNRLTPAISRIQEHATDMLAILNKQDSVASHLVQGIGSVSEEAKRTVKVYETAQEVSIKASTASERVHHSLGVLAKSSDQLESEVAKLFEELKKPARR